MIARVLGRVLGLGFGLALTLSAVAQDGLKPLPPIDAHVVDTTGTLDEAAKAALEAKLAALEQRKGAQMVVVMVPSTQPEEIEQYSIRLAEQGKIGRAKTDDGVIILIAKDDRRMRIEVGYGLEGAIPDALAKRVMDEYITPPLRAGDFSAALNAGVDALTKLIDSEALPEPWRDPAAEESSKIFEALVVGFFAAMVMSGFGPLLRAILAGLVTTAFCIFLIGIGPALLIGALSAAGSLIFGFFQGGSGSFTGGSGSGGFGGGFSGGGGGGFSSGGGFSGGGGSFGGGGASGSW